MEKDRNLVLTGWGFAEYVASAAVALKALGGKADVRGMSRRRLPEFLSGLAEEDGAPRWRRIWMLGVSLSGNPETLAAALPALKEKGVAVTWISAMPMPANAAPLLKDVLDVRVSGKELLDAVGAAFSAEVAPLRPFAKGTGARSRSSDVRAYLALIDAAQFAYRNYQDESLYEICARCMAGDVKPAAWPPAAKAAVEHWNRYGGRELLGKSRVVVALQDRINRVAAHEYARVLILGESGTGKETVAQQIHTKSPRRDGPFIAFNCASVAKELLEDRFFGHEKGAFTNAVARTDGLFSMADGGTLFLDEIGEMPSEVQALLLRVLEGGRFMRVGGREELTCDVRLVTATNRDLPALVRDGRFREDLYQRLNVVQLRTPPLREHPEDIPIIANHWWRANHCGAVLSTEQLAALADYPYPGNVRELINILDRATALEENDFAELMREHKELNAALFQIHNAQCKMQNEAAAVARTPPLEQGGPNPAPAAAGATKSDTPGEEPPDNLEEAMRQHVRRVMAKCGGNLTRAANALGISRNTVRKYL